MPFEARIAVGLVLAALAAYALTHLAIRVAASVGFYDKPAGYKGHGRPTPYLGGAAVVTAVVVVMLLLAGHPGKTLPVLGGMAVLSAVGTVDDRLNISPALRVAFEVGAASVLWAAGLGWDVGAGGAIDLVLTIAWVVAVVNALNLFDNMDGAASTMAAVAAGIVVLLGITHDDHWLAVSAAVLLGACAGFLPHNLASPARIFLGDGGSMPVGFAVAALVMVGSSEAAPAGQSLLLGLLLVGVPAADTFMVIISRRRRGVGVLTGGRDHLTHRTRQWLRTARAVAMGLGAVQALVSAVAVFAIRGGSTWFLVILVLYAACGATAIAFLETRYEETVEAHAAAGSAALSMTLPREPSLLLAGAFGVALGATPFASGLYSQGKWVPIGLGLLILTTVVTIARPVRPSRAQMLTLGGLVGLGLWGLASTLWAPSIAEATVDANRWLVLAAVCATAVVLIRSERAARWLTGGIAAGVAVVAAYVLLNLLGSTPGSLLLGGRLNQPLGYVNAEGTTFLMGFWLWFALVEHRNRLVAAGGLAMATTMAGLVALTQSRGAALALIASLLVVAALPGHRLRRILALLAIAAGLAVVSGPLVAVYDGRGATADCRLASLALAAISMAVGAVWWFGHVAVQRIAVERPSLHLRLPRIATTALATLAFVGAAVAVAEHGSIDRYVSGQWNVFVNLADAGTANPTAGTLHLASGAGYRYDYWRIAWDAFLDRPLDGVGAGNYDRPYFEARATNDSVRQPHSLVLQELSELGLVGGLLLACLAGCLAWGITRVWRVARATGSSSALAVGATGVAVAWFVHTNVDWIHLFPGVTGIALALIAVLLRAGGARAPVPVRTAAVRRRPRARTALAAVAGSLVLVLSAASLSRSGLASFFRDRAQTALATNPEDAILQADRSLRLDAEEPRTYYIKAAALARFNDAVGARRTLERALAKEPDNFVTWTLLGDLAVRTGDFRTAAHDYRQGLRFNPTDPTLKSLAADPTQAAG